MAFDLRNLDYGKLARGAAGVAIPALLGALAGGGQGALVGGLSGLGGVAKADAKQAARRRQEEAERAAIEGLFGQSQPALAPLGGSPDVGVAGAPPSPSGDGRLQQLAAAIPSLREGSALGPVIAGEMQSILAQDDPLTAGQQLQSERIDLDRQKFLQESEIQAEEGRRASEKRARMDAIRANLPETEQFLFDIDPEGYAAARIDRDMPAPLDPTDRFKVVGTDLVDISGQSPEVALRGRRNEPLVAVRDPETGETRYQLQSEAAGGLTPRKEEPLVAVRDPETGETRYRPRSEAAGGLVPPKQGIRVGTDADGNPVVNIGGDGQEFAPLGKAATNEVEKQMVGLTGARERLDRIQASFDPKFTQYLPQMQNWMNSIKSKAGFELSPEQSQALQGFTRWKQTSLTNVNQTIKDITGAAMTDGEAKRIIATLPNPDDSPEEFVAKLNGAMEDVKMSFARLSYIRKNGLPLEGAGAVTLGDMDGIIEQRGMDIEQQLRDAGLEGDSLDQALAQALQEEFSI